MIVIEKILRAKRTVIVLQKFNLNRPARCTSTLIALGLLVFTVFADDIGDETISDKKLAHRTLSEAEVRFGEAEKIGNLWINTRQHLITARSDFAAGRHDEAIRSAELVIKEASAAINQTSLERARYLLTKLDRKGIDDTARERIVAAIKAGDGPAALRLVRDTERSR